MLFRLNMYRVSIERRKNARLHMRDVALSTLILGVNGLALLMFLGAINITNNGIEATEACLRSREEVLGQLADDGGALTEGQLDLLKERVDRMSWSAVLHKVAAFAPNEVFFTDLSFATEGRGKNTTAILEMRGRMKAELEEEGVDRMVEFVQELSNDQYFGRHFHEVKLADMSWVEEDDNEFLGFVVTCELRRRPR